MSGRRALRFGLAAFAAAVSLSISAAEIAWVVILLALLFELWKSGEKPGLEPGPVAKPWAFYLAAVMVASLLGVSWRHSSEFIFKELQKPLVFYLFAAALSREPEPRLARWLFAGLLASALLGLYQIAAWHGLPHVEAHPVWLLPNQRAHGTIHPVTFGETMVLFLCGALAFYLRPDERPGLSRPVLMLLLSAGLAALLLSSTRGAWNAMLAAAVVFTLRAPRRMAPLLAAAAVLVAAALMPFSPVAPQLWDRLGHFSDPKYTSNATRIELWKTALRMAKDHPLLGVGLNNYWTEFPKYHPEFVQGRERWGSVHDLYLQHLAERGLLGLAALLFLLWTFLREAWAQERRRRDAWSLWAAAATAAFLFMNITETTFQVATTTSLFLFIWVWSRSVPPLAGSGS